MSGKTVSLTMTVRELDAVAFACLREHAKLDFPSEPLEKFAGWLDWCLEEAPDERSS